MTWMHHLDWTEVMVGVEEGVEVAEFRVVVKGKPEVRLTRE